jgi:hypothetical protein
MPWNKALKTEGAVLKEYAITNGILTDKIFVTKDVENTADEAVAVKELISPSKRIILDFLPSADYLKITEIGFREIFGRLFYLVKG